MNLGYIEGSNLNNHGLNVSQGMIYQRFLMKIFPTLSNSTFPRGSMLARRVNILDTTGLVNPLVPVQ